MAAGAAESVLAVTHAVRQDQFGPSLWADVGLRLVVYSVALALTVHFARGRRWARTALTVLLTGVGLASLVVPAVMSLLDGQSVTEALSGETGRIAWAFVAVRLLHIACVVVASVAMYTPSANRHFARSAKPATLPAHP
ncbi:hypothetical protein Raf01_56210 [Rugosimonospora africana]|uniref:Uncharacterized protein n=1 Tax=Rugosimonospora africana TaxID=556532 RepID=A0A8J3QUT7_9ACTN|nr:hypothetical protein Raf01_56210 [Rugosimonospora africana]